MPCLKAFVLRIQLNLFTLNEVTSNVESIVGRRQRAGGDDSNVDLNLSIELS